METFSQDLAEAYLNELLLLLLLVFPELRRLEWRRQDLVFERDK